MLLSGGLQVCGFFLAIEAPNEVNQKRLNITYVVCIIKVVELAVEGSVTNRAIIVSYLAGAFSVETNPTFSCMFFLRPNTCPYCLSFSDCHLIMWGKTLKW